MKTVVILPAAERDIGAIWDFTAERWGRAQADDYVATMSALFRRIADGTASTRTADDVKPGLRRAIAGRHVIFFRQTKESAVIVRVLHQRMDAGRWIE